MRVSKDMIHRDLRVAGAMVESLFRFECREDLEKGRRLFSGNPHRRIAGFDSSQHFVTGRDGNSIGVRVFKPKKINHSLPALLFFHGGGYAMGAPEMDIPLLRKLLKTRDCVIVAPDYRLSLDAPYPAALHDGYDTLLWIKDHASELQIDHGRIMVGGLSAGGGLTAAIALMARDLGDVKLSFQMPLYPMLDHRMETPSMKDNNAPVWNEVNNRTAWDCYLAGTSRDSVSCYASPSMAEDYGNLPPCFSYIGSLDPFHDELMDYAENLRAAGVSVEYRVFQGAYHAFETVQPFASVSKEALAYLIENFAYAVDHYRAT